MGFALPSRRGEIPGEKPRGARTTANNRLNLHMTPVLGIERRSQFGGRC